MELNDFMDLNTTELFDDSNDSFDKDKGGNECESNVIGADNGNGKTKFVLDNKCVSIIVDDVISSDAGPISTDLVSFDFFFHSKISVIFTTLVTFTTNVLNIYSLISNSFERKLQKTKPTKAKVTSYG